MNYVELTYRVLHENGETAGTAFLVAPRILMTCAHVVSHILKGDQTSRVAVGSKVSVRSGFPNSSRIDAIVAFHTPYGSSNPSQDVALLQLPEVGYIWRRAPYWCLQGISAGRDVITWGFPSGYEKVGAFAKGAVQARAADNSWQVDRIPGQGAPVQEGMSGAGVFDTMGRLMGMVGQADANRDTFFVIPFDSFRHAAHALKLTFSVAPNREKEALEALLELNFQSQVEHYISVAADHPIPRAFLIHGKPRHGHHTIAHRIISGRLVGGGGDEIRLIPMTFGRFEQPNTEAFYGELAEQIGIEPPFRREAVLATLADMLRSDSIVLFVRTGPYTNGEPKAIQGLVDEFWGPLTQVVDAGSARGAILMVLLDEGGHRASWTGLPGGPQHQVPKEQLVELPELTCISKTELRSWLVQRASRLAAVLPADVWVEAIWRNSQEGLPDAVFHRFCAIFNQEWDKVKQWLLCS